MMTETHFTPTRLMGWRRIPLPASIVTLFGTPMLWSLGVFDSTADPLRNAAIFGLCGLFLSCCAPWCVGWTLQGFLQRNKTEQDGLAEPVPAPHRPGGPAHAGRHS